jgi:hypothetical protein
MGAPAKRGRGRKSLHEPTLATILMVERAIHEAENYPTKAALWRELDRKVQYQTFSRVIDYLLSSNKIILNGHQIVWVFPDNPKLKKFLNSNVKVPRKR